MNASGSDVMQAKGVIKERIKVRDGVPFTWRLLVNIIIHSQAGPRRVLSCVNGC